MPRPDSWAETESDRAETKRKWLANCSTIEPFDFDEGILLETLRFREPVLSFPNETACDTACSATSVLDEAIASLRDERTLLADVLSRWQHDFFHQLDAHTRTFRDSAHQWRTEIDQLNTSQQHMCGEKDPASDEDKHATHDLLLPRYQVRAFSSDEGDFSGMFFDLATSSEFQEASTDRRDKPMVSPSSSSSDVSGDSFSHWHMLDKEHVLGTISCFLILLNTVFVGLKTHINLERAKDQHSNAISLTVIDGIFTIAFFVEVGVRIFFLRTAFWKGRDRVWNLFDVILTLTSVLEWVVSIWDLVFFRAFRIFRVVKVLRLARNFGSVRELRLMVDSIIVSLPSLLWACVFLMFILYLFSVFIALDVTDHIQSNSSVEGRLLDYYGSIGHSMLSLFMAISGGTDWETLLAPLQHMNYFYTYFFVFYIFFTVFGIMNVLTAVFVEAASRICDIDRDYVIQDQLEQKHGIAKALTTMFNEATQGTMMDRTALEAHLRDSSVIGYLRFLDLDVGEALNLFDLLDWEEKGVVSTDDFVQGMMRLKGSAKGVDVATLLYENNKVHVQLTALAKFVEDNFAMLSDATKGDDGSSEWMGLNMYVANEMRETKKMKRFQHMVARNRAQKSTPHVGDAVLEQVLKGPSAVLNEVSAVVANSKSYSDIFGKRERSVRGDVSCTESQRSSSS